MYLATRLGGTTAAVVLLLVVATSTASGQDNRDELTLRQLEQELCDLSVKPDPKRMSEIFADDYTAVGSRGRTSTKSDVLAPPAPTGNRTESCSEENIRVRIYGGDAAVVTGLGIRAGVFNGVSYKDRKILWTDTFIKKDGRWQLVASHSTVAAEPR